MKFHTLFTSLSGTHKLLISALMLILFIITLIPSESAKASKGDNANQITPIDSHYYSSEPLPLGQAFSLPLNQLQQASSPHQALAIQNQQSIEIESGDNLSLIFDRAGFSATTLHYVANSGKEAKILAQLVPGKAIEFYSNNKDELIRVSYQANQLQTIDVILNPANNEFKAQLSQSQEEIRLQFNRGDITSSFWNAGVKNGLSDGMVMEFAAVFGWDVDFALDIRPGDSFAVLYEKRYVEGEYVGYGKILAAEFINQGDVFKAVRHSDGNFYSPTGKSMQKTFLRAPVNFKYISSSFNPRRLHPVTGKVRAHRGIDYAARVGTPIMSTGSGTVIKSAYNKYNGNFVFIKHSNKYITKYLHLQKRTVRVGQRVKQGQKIGTLGSTGRVTGPHLHYEFLVNGVHKNPRTVKYPQAKSIDNDQRDEFVAIAQKAMERLQQMNAVLLAARPDTLPASEPIEG